MPNSKNAATVKIAFLGSRVKAVTNMPSRLKLIGITPIGKLKSDSAQSNAVNSAQIVISLIFILITVKIIPYPLPFVN